MNRTDSPGSGGSTESERTSFLHAFCHTDPKTKIRVQPFAEQTG